MQVNYLRILVIITNPNLIILCKNGANSWYNNYNFIKILDLKLDETSYLDK